MNILSTEEMRQAEAVLAKIPINPTYQLTLPSQRQFLLMATFEGTVFPPASPSAQKAVQKMITLTENMRSLKQSHPNALFHMLTLALINILYQDKYSASAEGQDNSYLLETIKCSLYSNDVDFKLIKNVDFHFQTRQLKLLIQQFFTYMEAQSLTIKTNRINSAEWIFQHNPLLLATFTLFLRLILAKIGLDHADDYRKCVDTEDAIMNLIEYFDLHYRSFGELILFYEDGLFLSLVERQIVVGQYYQNQRQKENQKQQLEIKSSVKLNMIESFLVNANEKQSMTPPKKKGIVDSDLKLFNFMLENSSEDQNEQPFAHQHPFAQKEKENDIETPNFKDNSEQFHFMRKKKSSEFKPEEVRNQFQRLIMDQSQEFIQEQDIAPTPYLGGENQFAFVNFANKQLTSTQQIDSPIDQLNNVQNPKLFPQKQPPKSYFQFANFRQTNEDMNANIFANGFSSVNQKKEMIISTFTDTQHRTSKKDFSCDSWFQIASCNCRKAKAKRNFVTSKVVEVQFVPDSSSKYRTSYLSNVTSPKFLNNYKPLYDRNGKAEEFMSKHKPKQPVKKEDRNYQDRKPAFLKNLKKNKAQSTLQDFSRSLVNQPKKYQQSITKQTSQERLRFGKFNSCVEEIQQPEENYSRSTPKHYENKTTKTVSQLGDKERNNEKVEGVGIYRSGVAKPWQTNSNFIHKIPQYAQMNKVKSSQMSNPNTAISSTSPLKFFAPVQIIAPTVYLNSNTNHSNNIVFKLDDGKVKGLSSPQAKPGYQESKTQRMFKANNSQSHVKIQTPSGRNQRQGQYQQFL